MKRRSASGETAEIGPDAVITKAEGTGAGQALLEAALGSAEAVTRVVGKPSLSSKGTSPSQTLRLRRDMDDQLVARPPAQHASLQPSCATPCLST